VKRIIAALLMACLAGAGCLENPRPNGTASLPEDLLLLRQIGPALDTMHHDDIPSGTRLAIVPHHLVAMREIVSLLSSWPDPKPKRVFLISPDHFSQGKTVITSLEESFSYQNAVVENDPDTVGRLAEAVPAVTLQPKILQKEHGIDALIPLLDKTMPGAKIIPLTIRIDAGKKDLNQLIDFLRNELKDPDTAVIGSIDMSHYLSEAFADLHDAYTIDAMKRQNADNAWKMEIDSPGSMYVILSLAKDLGLGDVRIQDHTNSLRLAQALVTDIGTSHILATFSPGPAHTQRETHTTLFAPQGISTEENRLYYGQDEIRSPLPAHPDVAITAIASSTGTVFDLVPLVRSGNAYIFMPREQRLPLLEEWKKNGTWDGIVKQAETSL
jgi:AmmeMemoRadiSam system protein B